MEIIFYHKPNYNEDSAITNCEIYGTEDIDNVVDISTVSVYPRIMRADLVIREQPVVGVGGGL